MPTAMPVLETLRVAIRPFTMDDLLAIHRILDYDLAKARPAKAVQRVQGAA